VALCRFLHEQTAQGLSRLQPAISQVRSAEAAGRPENLMGALGLKRMESMRAALVH
jgi:hypothetical protein